MQSLSSVRLSVCPSARPFFPLYLRNRLTFDLELLHVSIGHDHSSYRRFKIKIKVKIIGQANAVGPTSIEGSVSSYKTKAVTVTTYTY